MIGNQIHAAGLERAECRRVQRCRRVTVADCVSLAPVSELAGYRRHTFYTSGQQTLFLRCRAEHGRHDFAVGWLAAGPNAFDCSGLTMMAWAQAGVALPHSSSAQFGSGPHVAESDLRPGDLVFYYSPISHVGMYIGNGMIVHAANPGTGVTVSSLHSMPYVGAVRPG